MPSVRHRRNWPKRITKTASIARDTKRKNGRRLRQNRPTCERGAGIPAHRGVGFRRRSLAKIPPARMRRHERQTIFSQSLSWCTAPFPSIDREKTGRQSIGRWESFAAGRQGSAPCGLPVLSLALRRRQPAAESRRSLPTATHSRRTANARSPAFARRRAART